MLLFPATGTLGPQADGAGNDLLVGRYLQLGMLFYIILSIPSLVIWSILTEKTIVWFGFDPETAEIGQGYAFPFLAMAFFDGVSDCLHQFLDITDHEKYSTVVGILSYALQTIALVVMAVLGYTDLVFIGIVQAFVSFLMMVFNFSWAIYMGWLDDYWEGLVLTSGLRVSFVKSFLMT